MLNSFIHILTFWLKPGLNGNSEKVAWMGEVQRDYVGAAVVKVIEAAN